MGKYGGRRKFRSQWAAQPVVPPPTSSTFPPTPLNSPLHGCFPSPLRFLDVVQDLARRTEARGQIQLPRRFVDTRPVDQRRLRPLARKRLTASRTTAQDRTIVAVRPRPGWAPYFEELLRGVGSLERETSLGLVIRFSRQYVRRGSRRHHRRPVAGRISTCACASVRESRGRGKV